MFELCRSTWYKNKHFRGAYGFRNLKTTDEEIWSARITTPVMNEKHIPVSKFTMIPNG